MDGDDVDLDAIARRVRALSRIRYEMLVRIVGKILLLAELENDNSHADWVVQEPRKRSEPS